MGVRFESFRNKISESLTAVVNSVNNIGSTESIFCNFSYTLMAAARNSAPLVLSFTRVESSIALHSYCTGLGKSATSSCNSGLLSHEEAHNQGSHSFEG